MAASLDPFILDQVARQDLTVTLCLRAALDASPDELKGKLNIKTK